MIERHQSIREGLNARKSAASLALTGLSDQELLRSYSKLGKRKRYFEANVRGWLERSKQEDAGGEEL